MPILAHDRRHREHHRRGDQRLAPPGGAKSEGIGQHGGRSDRESRDEAEAGGERERRGHVTQQVGGFADACGDLGPRSAEG